VMNRIRSRPVSHKETNGGRRDVGRRAWTWARLLGGALVLAVLVWRLGTGPFLDGVRGLGPGTLLAATAIGAVTTVCSAWRWRVVAAALGVGLPLSAAIAAYYRSQFLNSALPGGVLGDVHRGLRHGADAGDLGRGVRAVVWERITGQVVQLVLALAVLLALPSPLHAPRPLLAAAVAVAVIAVLAAGRVLIRHGPARLARSLRTAAGEVREVLLQPATGPAVVLASLVVCACLLGMFLVAARVAGVDGAPVRLLPLALIVLLAAALPLNIGGWGPREGVAAWVFAADGWGAGRGAAAATAFGVMTLMATLPGAVVLVVEWLRPRPTGPRPEQGASVEAHGVVHSGAQGNGVPHG
jgi:glycosyltransferase 2 family protein